MNRFEWVNATSVEQALASVTPDSSFKAGGVDLVQPFDADARRFDVFRIFLQVLFQ